MIKGFVLSKSDVTIRLSEIASVVKPIGIKMEIYLKSGVMIPVFYSAEDDGQKDFEELSRLLSEGLI